MELMPSQPWVDKPNTQIVKECEKKIINPSVKLHVEVSP